MSECLVCASHTHNAGTCEYCQDKIGEQLTQISVNWEASQDPTLTPKNTKTAGRSISNPLPGGTAWLSWRAGTGCEAILKSWVETFTEHLNHAQAPPVTVTDLCQWLINHLTAYSTHPAVGDFNTELIRVHKTSRYHAGLTNPPKTIIQCPAQPNGEDCDHDIPIHTDLQPLDRITCRNCQASWTRLQLEHIALTSNGNHWVDPEVASRYSGISESMLRRQARQGKIERHKGRYNLTSIQRATPET